jgi:RND family efflux transporter MFP subunit
MNANTTEIPQAQKTKGSPLVPAIVGIVLLLGIGLFLRSRGAATKAPAEGANRGSQIRTVKVVPVTTGTIVERLAITGSLKANQNIDLNPKIAGRVAAVYVNEGQRVNRGQLLATLDSADLSEAVAQARANLQTQQVKLEQTIVGLPARVAQVGSNIETARANLATAKARYQQALLNEPTQIANSQSQVVTAKEGVKAAQSRLKQARDTARQTQQQVAAGVASARSALAESRASLEQIRNGSRAQQIGAAQAQVNVAEAQVRDAETNLNRQRQLFEGGATAKATVDTAQTAYDVAKAQLEAQRQNLSLVREGSRTEEVRAAEEVVNQREAALRTAQSDQGNVLSAQQAVTQALAALGQAQQTLATAQANLSTIPITRQETRTAKETVNTAQTALNQAIANRSSIPVAQQDVPAARAAVQSAQVQLNQALLNLSYTRIVSPISGTINTKTTDVGESASSATSMFNIVSSDNVYFEAQIPESQLARIEINQPAQITVGAVSDQPIVGYVTDIIRVADPSLRQFRVRITLPNSGKLTPGAFARGQLQTQVIKNTLTVPSEIVRTDNGENYLLLATGSGDEATVKRRNVRTGASAGGIIQILGGVQEGDKAITGNTLFEDGDKVRISTTDATSSPSEGASSDSTGSGTSGSSTGGASGSGASGASSGGASGGSGT